MSADEQGQAVPDVGAASPRLQDVLMAHRYSSPIARSHPWAVQKNPAGCAGCSWEAVDPVEGGHYLDQHAEHQAAVWREACTIRTVAQLDALPVGSVVMPLWYLAAGPCWRLSDGWFGVFIDKPMYPLGARTKPDNSALLVWHPDWSDQ